jgi:hypothetical protein
MPVAKSYAGLKIEEGPYQVNGRMYCKVRQLNGGIKQVRWYSEAEYKRMYPGEIVHTPDAERKTQKDILGFEKGYITIFKGDTYSNLEWFKRSIARYCRMWGWYIVSTDELPADIPASVIPVQLPWELVGKADGTLMTDGQIAAALEPLLYDASPSEFQGNIGDRIEKVLTVRKNICLQGAFGVSSMHIFEDENENIYVWTTTSKSWPEGSEHKIRGTIKDHKTYKNCKQTVLTRCVEV